MIGRTRILGPIARKSSAVGLSAHAVGLDRPRLVRCRCRARRGPPIAHMRERPESTGGDSASGWPSLRIGRHPTSSQGHESALLPARLDLHQETRSPADPESTAQDSPSLDEAMERRPRMIAGPTGRPMLDGVPVADNPTHRFKSSSSRHVCSPELDGSPESPARDGPSGEAVVVPFGTSPACEEIASEAFLDHVPSGSSNRASPVRANSRRRMDVVRHQDDRARARTGRVSPGARIARRRLSRPDLAVEDRPPFMGRRPWRNRSPPGIRNGAR